jgi:hypothetical protein
MDTSPDSYDLSPVTPPDAPLAEGRPGGPPMVRKPVSFTIGTGVSKPPAPQLPNPQVPKIQAPGPNPNPPFPLPGQMSQLPLLPRRKRPTFSRHRHDANPALAVKVLQDIQLAVEAWHQDLRQTVQSIQDLYMEGPIVDGWLEAVEDHPDPTAELDAALLRHGDPQALSGYVERLCQSLENPTPPPGGGNALGRAGYRLCSLDSDGRVQHFPCPPEQLSTISLAIARHQKLRQLLDHKRFLEAKLKRTVDLMTSSRDTLGIAPTCSSAPEVGAE